MGSRDAGRPSCPWATLALSTLRRLPSAGPGEWLDELAADYHSDQITPATPAVAGLAAAELRTVPAVLELDPRHRPHAAPREIEALRARYAATVVV
jgi:hypothetical protein